MLLVSGVITSNYIFVLSFRSQCLRSTSLSSPNGDTTHRSNLIDIQVHTANELKTVNMCHRYKLLVPLLLTSVPAVQ